MSTAQKIAEWLKTKPGPFRSNESDEDVWALVFAAAITFNRDFAKIDFQTFKDAMIRCGYESQSRGGHSGIAQHYVINLPEHQAGSRQ